MKLENQVAIVTGGGTGIGEGIALALSKAGVRVVVCGRRLEPLQLVVKAINNSGGDGLAIQADVSQEVDVRRIVAHTQAAYGTVHILVNNAGIGGGGLIHQHSISQWDRILSINLRGPFLMSRLVLPLMRQQRQGHIINISSESAMEHYPGNGAYGVAKHGLNALSEYIQRENQEAGIRVDTICPGMVVSEMSANAPGLDHNKCLYPEDIADLTLWLLNRRGNVKIGRPILIQTMENPWQ